MCDKEIVVCAAIWVQDHKNKPHGPVNIPSGTVFYDMMDGNQLKYEFDNRDLDHITFKGDGKESFSFNRALVENLIETFETMQDIYSDNYRLKVYTGNCIIQLNANPKDPSKSFFDVYDRDGMKLIYSIQNSILKEMFVI